MAEANGKTVHAGLRWVYDRLVSYVADLRMTRAAD